jgi:hypothetical protein
MVLRDAVLENVRWQLVLIDDFFRDEKALASSSFLVASTHSVEIVSGWAFG